MKKGAFYMNDDPGRMNDFGIAGVPRLLFGPGKISELPSVSSFYGRKMLLITGKSSFAASEVSKPFFEGLDRLGIKSELFIVENEPSPANVDDIVGKCRDSKPDVVVFVGGGSVIDAGKAVSAMLTTGGKVADYLEGVGSLDHPGSKIPFIAVPTTSGTGSEATKNAVLSLTGEGGYKRSLRHDNFIPEVAIVDPRLVVSCPPAVTAASGMDSFTQLLEAYVSVRSNIFTDSLAVVGIKLISRSLLKCYHNGSDLEARSEMAYAAFLSGICLANAGLGTVHGFASSIGGLYNIPHGVICGTLMSETNRLIVRKLRKSDPGNPALKKYAFLGRIIEGQEERSDDFYTDAFIASLDELTAALNLPGLGKCGVLQTDFVKIAGDTDMKNNPVKLNPDELIGILQSRY